jgi:hypothetical protein
MKVSDENIKNLIHLKSLKTLDLRGTENITDEDLAYLSKLESLNSLLIISEFITEKGIGSLSKLKSLELLTIGGSNVNDTCMEKLAQFPVLRRLWIQHSSITNEGLRLAELKNMKSLRALGLNYIPITGEGLAFLQEIPNLVELHIYGMKLGPAGFSSLAGMTSLEHLGFHIEVVNNDLGSLPDLKNLKTLDVTADEVIDKEFRHIARQKSLEFLTLNGSGITDVGLTHLEELNSLKYLSLGGTKVTEQRLEKLKRKIPTLIEYNLH